VCNSNLRQLGQALIGCQTKYDYFPLSCDNGRLPWQNGVRATWIDSLIQLGFLGNHKVGYCPADQRPDPLNEARGELLRTMYPGLPTPTRHGVDYSYGISHPLAGGVWNLYESLNYPPMEPEVASASRLLAGDAFYSEIYNLSADALARGDTNMMFPSVFDNTTAYRHAEHRASLLFADGHVETVSFDVARPATGISTRRVFVYFVEESVNQQPEDWMTQRPRDYPNAISPRGISMHGPTGGWSHTEVRAHKGWQRPS
jgi:prepilin-type processing-associated H-X9-DG protein